LTEQPLGLLPFFVTQPHGEVAVLKGYKSPCVTRLNIYEFLELKGPNGFPPPISSAP
jgi:hypothetical protein